jgi:hypothetical protein
MHKARERFVGNRLKRGGNSTSRTVGAPGRAPAHTGQCVRPRRPVGSSLSSQAQPGRPREPRDLGTALHEQASTWQPPQRAGSVTHTIPREAAHTRL